MMSRVAYFDICAFLILILLFAVIVIRNRIRTYQNHAFLLFFGSVFLSVTTSLAATMMVGQIPERPSLRVPFLIINSVYYAVHMLMALSYLFYVFALLNMPLRIKNRWAILFGPYLLALSLVIANAFTPVLFYLDEAGAYKRGSLSLLFYSVAVFYIGMSIYLLQKYRKMIRRKMRGIIYLYLSVCVLGMILQAAFSWLTIEGFLDTMSVLLAYISFQSPSDVLDPDTGLLNRENFLQNTNLYMNREDPFTMVFVSLGKLADIRMALGREQMQQLMRSVAEYLHSLNGTGRIYMAAEGCFAIAGRGAHLANPEELMQIIAERFHHPWQIGNNQIRLRATLWPISFPETVKTLSELLDMNTYLMDEEHQRGLEILPIRDMDLEDSRRMHELRGIIRESFENKTARVRFLPVYDHHRQRLITVEAVCCFQAGDGSWLSASEINWSNEQRHLLMQMDEYVLYEVLGFFRSGNASACGMEEVTVRISDAELRKPHFADYYLTMLQRYEVSPKLIRLKFSEMTLGMLSTEAKEALKTLCDHDCPLTIGDFGAGYTDLKLMMNLGVSRIDLGERLTDAASQSDRSLALVRGLTQTGHDLGWTVCMDGVRTQWQAHVAENTGCDLVQGSFFGDPLGPDALRELYRTVNRQKREEEV